MIVFPRWQKKKSKQKKQTNTPFHTQASFNEKQHQQQLIATSLSMLHLAESDAPHGHVNVSHCSAHINPWCTYLQKRPQSWFLVNSSLVHPFKKKKEKRMHARPGTYTELTPLFTTPPPPTHAPTASHPILTLHPRTIHHCASADSDGWVSPPLALSQPETHTTTAADWQPEQHVKWRRDCGH